MVSWIVLSGGASIVVMSLYDVILAKTLNLRISILRTIRIGYIVNALNSVIGFGGFIGASVRFYFIKIRLRIKGFSPYYFNCFSIHVNGSKFIVYFGCITYF